jgi:large subunit ribosomal protein L18
MQLQVIDDLNGRTLAGGTTCGRATEGNVTVAKAVELARAVADAAKEQGVTAVVFDRGGRKYHGRVKAVADAVRESGIRV